MQSAADGHLPRNDERSSSGGIIVTIPTGLAQKATKSQRNSIARHLFQTHFFDMNNIDPKSSGGHPLKIIACFFALAGSISLVFGVLNVCKHWFSDEKMETAANVSLHSLGMHFVHEIQRTVSPAIQRTKKLAADQEIIRALRFNDRERLTELCNEAVCNSTEVDAVALFGPDSSIVAINQVFSDGRPIPQNRVDRIMKMDF